MARYPEAILLKTASPPLPYEVLAFLRYLGIDPHKPHVPDSLLELIANDPLALYPVWIRFCGHTAIPFDTIRDLIRQIHAPTPTAERAPKKFVNSQSKCNSSKALAFTMRNR